MAGAVHRPPAPVVEPARRGGRPRPVSAAPDLRLHPFTLDPFDASIDLAPAIGAVRPLVPAPPGRFQAPALAIGEAAIEAIPWSGTVRVAAAVRVRSRWFRPRETIARVDPRRGRRLGGPSPVRPGGVIRLGTELEAVHDALAAGHPSGRSIENVALSERGLLGAGRRGRDPARIAASGPSIRRSLTRAAGRSNVRPGRARSDLLRAGGCLAGGGIRGRFRLRRLRAHPAGGRSGPGGSRAVVAGASGRGRLGSRGSGRGVLGRRGARGLGGRGCALRLAGSDFAGARRGGGRGRLLRGRGRGLLRLRLRGFFCARRFRHTPGGRRRILGTALLGAHARSVPALRPGARGVWLGVLLCYPRRSARGAGPAVDSCLAGPGHSKGTARPAQRIKNERKDWR